MQGNLDGVVGVSGKEEVIGAEDEAVAVVGIVISGIAQDIVDYSVTTVTKLLQLNNDRFNRRWA